MEKAKYNIRARHLLCMLGLIALKTKQISYWHDHASSQYMLSIIPQVKKSATTIELTTHADDICHHCKLCLNNQCFKFKYATAVYHQYDQQVLELLSLEENALYHPIYIIEQIQYHIRKKEDCRNWCYPCQLQKTCYFYQYLK